jgi:hypothetical protein
MITQEYLKAILDYCPETGVFTWIKTHLCSNKKPGDIAGHIHPKTGYVSITIDRKFNAAHRLAFLFMTGSYPKNDVDHINHVKHDNRWSNLRDVTNTINHQNKKMRKNNTSGVSGVYLDKASGKWEVRLRFNKETHYFGRHESKEEAIEIRHEQARILGFNENHGSK